MKEISTLIVAGSGSEDLELIDELLGEHELVPPLNTKIIKGNHIEVLGAKLILSAFHPETSSYNGEGDSIEEMVNLKLNIPKKSGARLGVVSSAALSSSSWGGRLE